jgi:hypothetical protein
MSFAQSLFNQLMHQSYSEFASARTTHKNAWCDAWCEGSAQKGVEKGFQ